MMNKNIAAEIDVSKVTVKSPPNEPHDEDGRQDVCGAGENG